MDNSLLIEALWTAVLPVTPPGVLLDAWPDQVQTWPKRGLENTPSKPQNAPAATNRGSTIGREPLSSSPLSRREDDSFRGASSLTEATTVAPEVVRMPPSPNGPRGRLSTRPQAVYHSGNSLTARTEPTRGSEIGVDRGYPTMDGSVSERRGFGAERQLMSRGRLVVRAKAALIEIFRRYDGDGDGALKEEELWAYLVKSRGEDGLKRDEKLKERIRRGFRHGGGLTIQGYLELYESGALGVEILVWQDLKAHGYGENLQLIHNMVHR